MNIIYLVICVGVGLIWRQWRLKNKQGIKKGTHLIPKGHNIYIFNPYSLTLKKIERKRALVNNSKYNPYDYQYQSTFPKLKYNHNYEVALIALNFNNAVKKARNLLNDSGYGPEYKTVNIKSA